MKIKIIKLIIFATVCFTVSSCGNKGDLILPEKQSKTTNIIYKNT